MLPIFHEQNAMHAYIIFFKFCYKFINNIHLHLLDLREGFTKRIAKRMVCVHIRWILGGSPQSGTFSGMPPCFADSMATSPGMVYRAAVHALRAGISLL